jgi:hypothetical protein
MNRLLGAMMVGLLAVLLAASFMAARGRLPPAQPPINTAQP